MRPTKYHITRMPEFTEWFLKQSSVSQKQIEKRLSNIELAGHFGHTNFFDGILEIKFSDGRRIYTAVFNSKEIGLVILILGGTKHGQSKDIAKAKKALQKILDSR